MKKGVIMKQKLMLVGLAILAGLPVSVFAKNHGKESGVQSQSYRSWESPFTPHYGDEGVNHPLMDHFNTPVVRDVVKKNWAFEMAPPSLSDTESDGPLVARDKQFGFSLKLSF